MSNEAFEKWWKENRLNYIGYYEEDAESAARDAFEEGFRVGLKNGCSVCADDLPCATHSRD